MCKGLKALYAISTISAIGTIASLILDLVRIRKDKRLEQTIARKVDIALDEKMRKVKKVQRYKATELGFTSTKVGL